MGIFKKIKDAIKDGMDEQEKKNKEIIEKLEKVGRKNDEEKK